LFFDTFDQLHANFLLSRSKHAESVAATRDLAFSVPRAA
jgi:hypothetical protein